MRSLLWSHVQWPQVQGVQIQVSSGLRVQGTAVLLSPWGSTWHLLQTADQRRVPDTAEGATWSVPVPYNPVFAFLTTSSKIELCNTRSHRYFSEIMFSRWWSSPLRIWLRVWPFRSTIGSGVWRWRDFVFFKPGSSVWNRSLPFTRRLRLQQPRCARHQPSQSLYQHSALSRLQLQYI